MSLQELPIELIDAGPRIRTEMGELEDLMKSFDKFGQIQTIAVQERPQTDGAVRYKLLAGGRRLAAMKLRGHKKILARIYPKELSKLDSMEIELAENLHRKDLTFQEDARLKRAIHNLRLSQFGPKISDHTTPDGWTLDKTGEMLGVNKQTIANAIIIADALEEYPELEKCKNQTEVLRNIKVKKTEAIRRELSRRASLGETVGDEKQQAARQALAESYILGDCENGLALLDDKSIDFFELDPPWGINYLSLGASEYKESYEDNPNEYIPRLQRILPHVYRCLKPKRWVVFWCAMSLYETTKLLLETHNFKCATLPAVWIKLGQQGPNRFPEQELTSNYECFIYARKEDALLTKAGLNTLSFIRPPNNIHPSEKPFELEQFILATFSLVGFKVCIPFLGSGNTLLAANSIGMSAFGWDLSETYRGGFLERLQTFTAR